MASDFNQLAKEEESKKSIDPMNISLDNENEMKQEFKEIKEQTMKK